jgi:hypothetical protein
MSELTRTAQTGTDVKPFREYASLAEGCTEFGTFLGLDGPVSEDVFVGAMQDPVYARNLIISRSAPAFLKVLLDKPPQQKPAAGQAEKTNVELLAKAARSLWNWTRSGMETVSDETYRRRLDRCAVCPHHTTAPNRAIYNLGAAFMDDTQERRICTLCGCVTANKARMATENCPSEDPHRPDFTRWGEPKL